jgi:hypothetical protein
MENKIKEEPKSERYIKTMYFYNQLDEPAKSLAIANYDEDYINLVPLTLESAIDAGFGWEKTKEGGDYWANVEIYAKLYPPTVQKKGFPLDWGKSDKAYDYINPDHYKRGGKETIDKMVDIWGAENVAIHCEITAFKYMERLGAKPDQPIERDLAKARWYINKAEELRADKDGTSKV